MCTNLTPSYTLLRFLCSVEFTALPVVAETEHNRLCSCPAENIQQICDFKECNGVYLNPSVSQLHM